MTPYSVLNQVLFGFSEHPKNVRKHSLHSIQSLTGALSAYQNRQKPSGLVKRGQLISKQAIDIPKSLLYLDILV